MTQEDEIRFGIFELKLRQLIDLHEQLKAENLELKAQLSAISEDLEKVRGEYAELESSYQTLKASRVLEGLDVDDIGGTRDRIARLVREVDHCIALLNA